MNLWSHFVALLKSGLDVQVTGLSLDNKQNLTKHASSKISSIEFFLWFGISIKIL